jgi:Ran-binding protein 1
VAMSDHEGDANELLVEEELAVSNGGAARFAAVEVLSGEEQWDVVWKNKGKILRFDEGENQWKERGQGDAKIMRNKVNPKRHMFILRREGIGKLAAQHDIVKGMKVKPHPQNDKFLIWTAVKDFSEDPEGWEESFLLKFPTKEIADEFTLNWNKVLPQ